MLISCANFTNVSIGTYEFLRVAPLYHITSNA